MKDQLPAKLPVIYEQAIKALIACQTLDEALYWDNKADALAAWAKIYHNDQAAREARALKLHAYRRMGQLAAEIQPGGPLPAPRSGKSAGPLRALIEHGMKRGQATAARRLATSPRSEVDAAINSSHPPSPSRFLATASGGRGSQNYKLFLSGSAHGFRSFCRKYAAAEFAAGMTADEAARLREFAIELSDWLDTFEQHLPKEKR